MNTEAFANTKIGQTFIRMMAVIMESRLRYRFFGPMKIIQGAEFRPGQKVLDGMESGHANYIKLLKKNYKKPLFGPYIEFFRGKKGDIGSENTYFWNVIQ